jgi:hypothetical protein
MRRMVMAPTRRIALGHMSARVCRSCDYNVISTVVSACPNCGEALPAAAPASSTLSMAALGLILVGGAAAFLMMREPSGGPAAPPAPPPTAAGRAAAPSSLAAPAVSPAAEKPDVAKLVALLGDEQEGYNAAVQLGKLDTPEAGKALMAAYDRREYGKMVGAAEFYARKRPPGYDKVLVALLYESRDLAVAQDLILSRDPRLAAPATKWAAEQGFKLVKSTETPTGVTWTSVSSPAQ